VTGQGPAGGAGRALPALLATPNIGCDGVASPSIAAWQQRGDGARARGGLAAASVRGLSYRPHRDSTETAGFSLIELVLVASLVAAMAAIAMPSIASALEETRMRSAVRYVARLLERSRMEAIARSASTAIWFERDRAFRISVYVDRNGNGVLTHDISQGIDMRMSGPERLSDHFADVRFGVVAGLPPVDVGADETTDDPVRTGGADLLVFTPHGTATPASLYILGPGGRQYVIRVFGDTGRVRSLRFDLHRRVWLPL